MLLPAFTAEAPATAAFNCATLTASVSSEPAAIPVICRVTGAGLPLPSVPFTFPTEIALAVDVQAAPVRAADFK